MPYQPLNAFCRERQSRAAYLPNPGPRLKRLIGSAITAKSWARGRAFDRRWNTDGR